MDTQQDTTEQTVVVEQPVASAPRRLLGKSAILAKQDTRYAYVTVPEWDGDVRVRSITGTERDEWESSLVKMRANGKSETNYKHARSTLCVRAIVDEDGKRVFDDTDAPILSTKNASAIDRIYEVAAALSKISDKDVEELVGNSASARSVAA